MTLAEDRSTLPVIIRGSCHHDCPDTCAWEVTVADGRAIGLRGSREHPMTRGVLCPKVNRFLDRVYHPDRILTPLVRTGPKGSGEFSPITWEDALTRIADRLRDRIDSGVGESVLQFSFDGTQGVIQKGIVANRFFDLIGASDIARHLCGATSWMGAADVYADPIGLDPESLRHARTILLWGTNTLITNRHLWPFIEEARATGAHVTVIDPIRTKTAERADDHLQLRPGTDVALVLSLIHVLDRDGLLDMDWIETRTLDWAELRSSAQEWTPQRAEEVTGIEAARIIDLAHRFATQRPSAVRVLIGPEHREQGREIMRAVAMLPAVTGAWRDTGGGLARSTQAWFEQALVWPARLGARRTINMACIADALLDPELTPAIDTLIVHNSNPAVILPDQERVIRALSREDLMTVVLEQFMTDTARYADLILPVTTQVEHLDLGIAWGHLYVSLNQPAISPVGQARSNSTIFRQLAAALGITDELLASDDVEIIRRMLASDSPLMTGIDYDTLTRDGWARLRIADDYRPYVDAGGPAHLDRLRLHRADVTFGRETPGSALSARYPLTLLTRKQHIAFLNANYGGFPDHQPAPGEPLLQMHPQDAEARGITEGMLVRIRNDRGELTMRVALSDEVLPGVVATGFGWWHASSAERRSINILTNAALPTSGVGSAAFHETLVEVEPTPAEVTPSAGVSSEGRA